jgi:hypothetical protein
MTLHRHISNLIARLSFFGPVSAGATIPAGARPMKESDDNTPADMDPETVERNQAGDGSAGGGDVAEGSGSDDSQASGTDGEADGETSGQPSSAGDTTSRAQKADDSVAQASAMAVRAAVDAVVASPDADAPGKMTVKFRPTITPEMIARYEKSVEAGKTAEGLADLVGECYSEMAAQYDEKRVLPIETATLEAQRVSKNNERIANWRDQNPEMAKDLPLWQAMGSIWQEYAAKFGVRRADRITLDQLAVMARGKIPGKSSPKATAAAQKAEALAATKTPGTIGALRPQPAAGKKTAVGHDGNGYRNHLKSASRDIW